MTDLAFFVFVVIVLFDAVMLVRLGFAAYERRRSLIEDRVEWARRVFG